jgi:hypothetical protein
MEKSEPAIITKIIAHSLNPNQIKAKGNQQILGRVWSPRIRLPNVLYNVLNLSRSIPKSPPKIIDATNPINKRLKLTIIAIKKARFLKPSIIAVNTLKGPGKIYCGQSLSAINACQRKSNAR